VAISIDVCATNSEYLFTIQALFTRGEMEMVQVDVAVNIV